MNNNNIGNVTINILYTNNILWLMLIHNIYFNCMLKLFSLVTNHHKHWDVMRDHFTFNHFLSVYNNKNTKLIMLHEW